MTNREALRTSKVLQELASRFGRDKLDIRDCNE
jgi:hypothetical protein